MLFETANKKIWLALIGKSQWLAHVVEFHQSSLYIVQEDFMFMGVATEITWTLFEMWETLVEAHIQCGWICST